jgi:hypothetical protein
MAGQSLLEQLQGLLERTYEIPAGLVDAGRFVIGDIGYVRLYGRREITEAVEAVESSGALQARTLLQHVSGRVRASIYFPDTMIRTLEDHPPRCGLNEENVEPFAVMVEELDHLLVMAQRAAEGRPATLFELELHANVSKHLVLSRFLTANGNRPQPARVAWLRERLFHRGTFSDEQDRIRSRYQDAHRFGLQFLNRLEKRAPLHRLAFLREFHRRSVAGKMELITCSADA